MSKSTFTTSAGDDPLIEALCRGWGVASRCKECGAESRLTAMQLLEWLHKHPDLPLNHALGRRRPPDLQRCRSDEVRRNKRRLTAAVTFRSSLMLQVVTRMSHIGSSFSVRTSQLDSSAVASDNKPAVFLQTGFRSCGTWVWSRFRANPDVLGYCEPLNEALAVLTPEISSGLRAQTSGLRHPAMDQPYFDEFLPLIDSTGVGVRGYQAAFGMNSYFKQPDALSNELRAYISSLLDHAQAQAKQPILKFTRGLGRAAWLSENFPNALQIRLQRAPEAHFASSYRQAMEKNNFTFLMIALWGLTQLKEPAVQQLLSGLPVQVLPPDTDLHTAGSVYTNAIRSLSLSQLAAVHVAFYTVSHALSADSVDLEIDIERLQCDAAYAASLSELLLNRAGVAVDFSTVSSDEERGCGNGDYLDRQTFFTAAHDALDLLEDTYPSAAAYTRRLLNASRR